MSDSVKVAKNQTIILTQNVECTIYSLRICFRYLCRPSGQQGHNRQHCQTQRVGLIEHTRWKHTHLLSKFRYASRRNVVLGWLAPVELV